MGYFDAQLRERGWVSPYTRHSGPDCIAISSFQPLKHVS